MTKPAVTVVWFKRDLRVHDHRPLVEGLRHGPVLPLYVAEPGLWAEPDASLRQWEFIRESLQELRAELSGLGQPLVVRTGEVTWVLSELAERFSLRAVNAHQETGNNWTYQRDLRVTNWCRSHGVEFREWLQFGVFRRLPSRDGWSKKWAP